VNRWQKLYYSPYETDHARKTDLMKFAEAMRIEGIRIEKEEDLEKITEETFGRPCLIEVEL
jgi:thiamine pyrophosphate-dependent acetolactate synthase large subunit-like protein